MSKENALFPQVKEEIAFDRLWPQVTETIATVSGKLWTDTADHDPGVTLLQAVTWNISDLSYRVSLPLNDLLTRQGEPNLFPEEFGPQNVLTCNAVTPGDYRRLLRDLTYKDIKLGVSGDSFLFDDARIIREPEDNRFQWWYDAENRTYSFGEPPDTAADKKTRMSLRGNCWLYLLPSGQLQSTFNAFPKDKSDYEKRIRMLLSDYRNLGEYFSRLIWLEPVYFSPRLTIELAEDVNDVNPVVAQVYETLKELLVPEAKRYTSAQLQKAGYSNEAIFEGPYLRHGWQTDAAPFITDGGITINFSPLFERLLAINGVASISQFSAGTLPKEISAVDGDAWSWQVASGYFPLLWGDSPLSTLTSANSPLTLIAKGGIYQYPELDKVTKYLTTPERIENEPLVLPAGRLRDLAGYTPVGNRLPDCYQLQLPAEVIDDSVRELHQFLLPVDQQLADNAAELAALPQLLAFTGRDKWNAVRGTRWPYSDDSVAQQVHKDYTDALTGFQQQDVAVFPTDGSLANFSRELDFIQYLLGYFGTSRAARPLTLNLPDFLVTQRAFLAQQPELGYDRINIRIDQVSALQKRIAARIGLDSEIFADSPDLGKLPFYVIEHRQLLPLMPDDAFTDEQTPTDFISDTKPVVTIRQKGSAGKIVQGQLIDLIAIEGESRLVVSQQLVISTAGDTFTLNTTNSQQLQNDLARLQAAWDGGNLRWQNSNIWLQDMDYRLNYADDQPSDSNQRRLASNDQSPYPTMVAIGDKIIIRPAGLTPSSSGGQATAKAASVLADDWMLEATITELKLVDETLVVEKAADSEYDFPSPEDAWRFQWNFSEAAYAIADRFSFVVSIVHNRSMIEIPNIEPAMLIDWMQREVMAEFPAHVSIVNLWLSDSAFKNFGATYKRWQNNGSPLGDDAFALMQMLTLGHLPVVQPGIGLMRIATEEQKAEVVGEDGTGWDTGVILDQELFYIPQALPAA